MTVMNTGSADLPTDPDPSVDTELRDLRLRVAAQDRLIAAMIDENESIHRLRRNSHEFVRLYERYSGTFPFDSALEARRRIRAILRRNGTSS